MNNNFENISNSQYFIKPDYQSVYSDTVKSMYQLYNAAIARYSVKNYNIIMAALLLVDLIIFAIVQKVLNIGNYYSFLLTGVLLFISLYLAFHGYLFAVLRLKSVKAVNNGQIPETVIDFKDKIYISCGVTKQEMNYSDITAFIETKDTYYLVFNKRVFLYIPKNSFTKGNSEEFKTFIISFVPPYKKSKLKFAFNLFTILILAITTLVLVGLIVLALSGIIYI